jgi:hypothetical protein
VPAIQCLPDSRHELLAEGLALSPGHDAEEMALMARLGVSVSTGATGQSSTGDDTPAES